MSKRSLDQNGSVHLVITLFTLVVLTVGGVGYYVHSTRNKPSTTNPQSVTPTTNTAKAEAFTSNRSVLESIGTSIEKSGLPVRLASTSIKSNTGNKFQDLTTITTDVTSYDDMLDFRIAQPCQQSCTGIENSSSEIATSSERINSETMLQLLAKIKSDLLAHDGVKLLSSGSIPGTYITHDYFITSVTVGNNSPRKLQVISDGGDGGIFISAYIYK